MYVVIYLVITFIQVHYFNNGILGLAANFSIFSVVNFFFGYCLLKNNFEFSTLSIKKIFHNIQGYLVFNQTLLLRSFLMELSFLSYIYTVSFFHETAFILYSFALRILFFFATFLESFLYTFESLSTKALGEKNKTEFIQLIKNNFFVSTIATLIAIVIISLGFSSLVNVFNIPKESLNHFIYPTVFISITLFFNNLTYIYEGILICLEQSKSLLIGTLYASIFLLLVFYMSKKLQLFEGVWVGMIGFYSIKTLIYKYYSGIALGKNLD